MRNQLGQSLIELIVTLGIFVIVVSTLAFLILNSYVAGRLAQEITQANFLAQEGLEAVRSIRDNSWQDLTNGDHGLNNLTGNWQFSGTSETIDGKFTRVIKVEEIDLDRKKVTSQVSWRFTEERPQEITLATYFTNWRKVAIPPGLEIRRPTAHTDLTNRTTEPFLAYDPTNGTTFSTTVYRGTGDSIIFHTWQTPTQPYTSLVLKYRYHADSAPNDKYAVAFSTDSGNSWTDLIPLTSLGAPDTTISVTLSHILDLSQLQVKIYTIQTGGPDNRNIYTRDIWTEGSF